MNKIQMILILLLMITGLIRVNAQAVAEIEKANKSCKAVFLVTYNTDGADADKAFSIANDAKKKLESLFSGCEIEYRRCSKSCSGLKIPFGRGSFAPYFGFG